MANTPEGKVKAWIKKQILDRYPNAYIYVTHVGQYGKRGVPDLVMCINGIFSTIEVKTESGKITELQKLEGRRIEKAGGIFMTVYGQNEKQMNDFFCMVDEVTQINRG